MTRIYLIRHAEAEGNLYRRAQGHWNGQVTSLGKKQIDALAERFEGLQIDALYSSDLSRAMETAEAIRRGRGIPLQTTPELREMCMGVWEGEAWGDIAWRYPEQMEYFGHDPARLSVPGSESFSHVQQRIENVLLEIAKRHDGQTVAVVTHGMAIRSFLCGVLGFCSSGIDGVLHGDNTSVSLIEVQDGKFKAEFYNDNSHLARIFPHLPNRNGARGGSVRITPTCGSFRWILGIRPTRSSINAATRMPGRRLTVAKRAFRRGYISPQPAPMRRTLRKRWSRS
jgi:probable phosphoglycerate mutase